MTPADSLAPMLAAWLEHIRHLSVEIGERGSTTEGERRGALYCAEQMDRIGLKPTTETFLSARSIFQPHLLGGLLMLLAFILHPLGGSVTAALALVISLIVLASELLELGFLPNPYRWLLPKGKSQNVHAVIPPAGEHHRDLLLVGHIDTQRTPLIFRTAAWVEAYKRFTTIVFVLFVAQNVLYLLGLIFTWHWVWYASIPTALSAVLLAAICLQADLTPFTAGANDNASAVGIVLALAEQLTTKPLQHTRVFAVCTGCEEVQHYGMIDFLRRHRTEMVQPAAFIFELVGCAGPGWLTQEGIVVPFQSDARLRSLAENLSQEHPELGAYPVSINGGNTEMADCVQAGIPAITLFGLKPDGEAPYWHQIGDTFDKIDLEVMARTWEFTCRMIEKIDAGNPCDGADRPHTSH
jgi:hypothetical protein